MTGVIQDKVVAALYQHAEECYPMECCGFIRNTSAGPELVPGINTHENPRSHYRMAIPFYAAYSVGAICMYHSHPDGGPQPSEGDKQVYHQSGIPQLIVSWPYGQMSLYGNLPAGVMGRPFIYGVYDCLSLVRSYYAEIVGEHVPDFVRPRYGWWDVSDIDPFAQYYGMAGFKPVQGDLEAGDVVLMRIAGARRANHAGVLTEDSRLLHHRLNSFSCRTAYDGYYRENTVMALRYGN